MNAFRAVHRKYTVLFFVLFIFLFAVSSGKLLGTEKIKESFSEKKSEKFCRECLPLSSFPQITDVGVKPEEILQKDVKRTSQKNFEHVFPEKVHSIKVLSKLENSSEGKAKKSSEVQKYEAKNGQSAYIQEVIQQGKTLEKEGCWSDAVKLYEEGLRQFPNVQELQRRYNFVRLHRDIYRRYSDQDFRKISLTLTEEDLSALAQEILQKLNLNFVVSLKPEQIMGRMMNGMEIALSNSFFREVILPEVSDKIICEFREEVRNYLAAHSLMNDRQMVLCILEIQKLARKYFSEAPARALMLEGLCGLIGTLDPYSSLLTPTQLQDSLSTIRGNFVGLGVVVKQENGNFLISRVIPGSPAEVAGVKTGDLLVGVNNKLLDKASADMAASFLQGEEGTSVILQLASVNGSERRSVRVRRTKVTIPSVESARILPGTDGMAYLRVPTFQDDSARILDAKLHELRREGMKSLVLDLRGNPGGLLLAAVELADLFLAEGNIVSIRGKYEYQNMTYRASGGKTWNIPLVVLIDRDSASASEIFAGAISENRRGQVLGEQSYGKGSVQGIYQLSRKPLGIKLTTSLFYSPTGRKYNHVGVLPDVKVYEVTKPALAETFPPVGNALQTFAEEEREGNEMHVNFSQKSAVTGEISFPEEDVFLKAAIQVLSHEKMSVPAVAGSEVISDAL
ncbi:MAG: S41 family peptidase [Planctomycetia bacterium]|nr:S41 family peptidase [Planctomycetia bacterium]